jgi:hypothetical protein
MIQAERVFINSLPTRCKTAEKQASFGAARLPSGYQMVAGRFPT